MVASIQSLCFIFFSSPATELIQVMYHFYRYCIDCAVGVAAKSLEPKTMIALSLKTKQAHFSVTHSLEWLYLIPFGPDLIFNDHNYWDFCKPLLIYPWSLLRVFLFYTSFSLSWTQFLCLHYLSLLCPVLPSSDIIQFLRDCLLRIKVLS